MSWEGWVSEKNKLRDGACHIVAWLEVLISNNLLRRYLYNNNLKALSTGVFDRLTSFSQL